MRLNRIGLITGLAGVLSLAACGGGGTYSSGGIRTSVGFGFYHSTYGHGWGGGYYRGYDDGVIDTVETIETLETLDALDSLGMPDMDFGPAIDFDF